MIFDTDPHALNGKTGTLTAALELFLRVKIATYRKSNPTTLVLFIDIVAMSIV